MKHSSAGLSVKEILIKIEICFTLCFGAQIGYIREEEEKIDWGCKNLIFKDFLLRLDLEKAKILQK